MTLRLLNQFLLLSGHLLQEIIIDGRLQGGFLASGELVDLVLDFIDDLNQNILLRKHFMVGYLQLVDGLLLLLKFLFDIIEHCFMHVNHKALR